MMMMMKMITESKILSGIGKEKVYKLLDSYGNLKGFIGNGSLVSDCPCYYFNGR